jgi:hypothetical protein
MGTSLIGRCGSIRLNDIASSSKTTVPVGFLNILD